MHVMLGKVEASKWLGKMFRGREILVGLGMIRVA